MFQIVSGRRRTLDWIIKRSIGTYMLVQIQYFSRLRDLDGPEKAAVSDEASIEELLNQLYASVPSLKAWDNYLLIAVDTEYVRTRVIVGAANNRSR
jgi:hypothetical protein